MYNRVYDYLNDNLFHKQFVFRKGHSTDHALMHLLIAYMILLIRINIH